MQLIKMQVISRVTRDFIDSFGILLRGSVIEVFTYFQYHFVESLNILYTLPELCEINTFQKMHLNKKKL